MKQQPPERTKRLAVIAAAAVILVMVLLIIETFRLLLPGLWTAFSSGDEQALSDYLTSEGRLRSFLTLWFCWRAAWQKSLNCSQRTAPRRISC